MKGSSLTLALVLLAPLLTSAQGTMQVETTRQRGFYPQGIDLTGKVSNDAKTLLADDDNMWNVSNMAALKGLEGRYVTVKCRMDPEKRVIRVLYILQPTGKHPENWTDSAFRR